jgi:hypothetical protein
MRPYQNGILDAARVVDHTTMMDREGSLALSTAALLLLATSPVAAQSSSSTTPQANGAQASSPPHPVTVLGYGTVYVVPVQPKDTRSPRQRCVDEEVAREGGNPSPLAMGAIDLKCSQR